MLVFVGLVTAALAGCMASRCGEPAEEKPMTLLSAPSMEQARYESTIKAAAAKLQADNPGMTRPEAFAKARKDSPYIPSTAETQQQSDAWARTWQKEADDKLVKELDKLKR